jgi:hypothetical protein
MADFFYRSKQNWLKALSRASFKKRLIPGCLFVAAILSAFPFFFQTIEKRNGAFVNDWILNQIPSHNLSVPIFIVIWATALLMLFRAIEDPYIFLVFIWSYIFVSFMRALSITFIPLNPPVGLVQLIDPLSNTFYGHATITKDLFFSGHTSTIFLIFLCLKNRVEKIIVLTATMVLALLLMVQHIHYVIDIVAAPVFTYIAYRAGRWIIMGGRGKPVISESRQ